GSWEAIYYQANSYDFAAPVAQPVEQAESFQLGLERIRPNRNAQDGSVLLQVAKPHLEIHPPNVPSKSEFMPNLSGSPRTVLFAGHDLKFARELMKHLEIQG